MNVEIHIGNVLDFPADVLISTANPWLNMSGGVNGAILARNGEPIQAELREYLRIVNGAAVTAGTVVPTSAGPLPFKNIIHVVAIDPFYDSSSELIHKTLDAAFTLAESLESKTISMPTLATGYGHLTIKEFAQSFAEVTSAKFYSIETIKTVVRKAEYKDRLKSTIEPFYNTGNSNLILHLE